MEIPKTFMKYVERLASTSDSKAAYNLDRNGIDISFKEYESICAVADHILGLIKGEDYKGASSILGCEASKDATVMALKAVVKKLKSYTELEYAEVADENLAQFRLAENMYAKNKFLEPLLYPEANKKYDVLRYTKNAIESDPKWLGLAPKTLRASESGVRAYNAASHISRHLRGIAKS